MVPRKTKSAAQQALPSGAAWPSAWEVAVDVRVERRQRAVLAEELADLLVAIEQTNSISAAARLIGISYRHAWKLVQEGNLAAGTPLVSAAVGGVNGGGTTLTPRGKLALDVFHKLRGKLQETAAGMLPGILDPALDLAASLHLAAAISLQEVVGQILAEHALRQPAVRVRAVYGASNELADHILAGAPCDLFLSADPAHVDRLAADRRVRIESRRVVAINSLAVVGHAKSRKLDAPDDLLAVSQVVLADPVCPLGKCSRAFLERAGIYDRLLPKVLHVDNSRGVVSAIESGRGEAGLVFASDAARATDCRPGFAIDPRAASLAYTAAVCKGKREYDAQLLLDFFATPTAQRCFRRCGLALPGGGRPRTSGH